MIKTVTVLSRRSDLTSEEFHDHWKKVHAPLVLAMPKVRRYVQCRPLEVPGREAPCDGVAEVWYDSVEDFVSTAASAEYARLLADEKNFMGAKTQDSVFVIVEEDEFVVG
ncbi:MAG: EthD domain-containing protein [bacterium]|nr:EthD family reductase [Acidimicrobiia bacterium]MCY4648999.1 EthD domain-containing protein [bacterium]